MYGSEQIHSVQFVIDADPGGTNELFYLMKAPRALTVVGFHATSEQAQNAGTAVTLSLQNWGTAGTAVESGGTIGSLGGTATAARLGARTPASASLTAAQQYINEGEWLTVMYGEEGSGWIAGDRLSVQVDYIIGKVG